MKQLQQLQLDVPITPVVPTGVTSGTPELTPTPARIMARYLTDAQVAALTSLAQYEAEMNAQCQPDSRRHGLVLPAAASLRALGLATRVPHSVAGHRITRRGLDALESLASGRRARW